MLITDIYLYSCLSSTKFKIDFKKGIPKEEGSRFRHFGGFELDFTMFRY